MNPAEKLTSEELTFEIDGPRITAETFRKAVNAFLDVIDAVAQDISGASNSVDWIVRVSSGSARIHCRPESARGGLPDAQIPYLLDTIQNGFFTIETRSEWPLHFNDVALQKAKDLASLVHGHEQGLDSIKIRRNGQTGCVTTKTRANVDTLFETASTDWGSIEGKLSGVREKSDRYRFEVYDDILEKRIPCIFPEHILHKVLNAFGKRVSVSGLIHHDRRGQVKSIKVEDFEEFPDPNTLPGFSEMRGLFRGTD